MRPMGIYEEQMEAWCRFKSGERDEMGAKFAAWYSGLIGSVAGKYAVLSRNDDREDFEQIGMEALIDALDTYNPGKIRLPGYIQAVVTRRCGRRLTHQNGAFSIPTSRRERDLQRGFGRDSGAMLEAGFSWSEVRETLALKYRVHPMDIDALHAMRHGRQTVAEDFEEGGDGAVLVGQEPISESALARSTAGATIETLFDAANLTQQERDCIVARFSEDEEVFLGELGERYGVTGERIRQIVKNGLAKVGRAAKKKGLAFEDFW